MGTAILGRSLLLLGINIDGIRVTKFHGRFAQDGTSQICFKIQAMVNVRSYVRCMLILPVHDGHGMWKVEVENINWVILIDSFLVDHSNLN